MSNKLNEWLDRITPWFAYLSFAIASTKAIDPGVHWIAIGMLFISVYLMGE